MSVKRLFLDTNIVIDLLGERQPYYEYAARIASLADLKQVSLYASEITFATTYHILKRYESQLVAKRKLRLFKALCHLAPSTDKVLDKALASSFKDLEDAMQHFDAVESKCDAILTRNTKDFKASILPVFEPKEFLAISASNVKS